MMRDLGVGNFMVNEEVKKLLDSKFILNPHLSVKRADSLIKIMKRNNKLYNYLFTKIKI